MLPQVIILIPCRRFSFKAGPPLGMTQDVNPSLEASSSLCSRRDTARSSPPKPAGQVLINTELLSCVQMWKQAKCKGRQMQCRSCLFNSSFSSQWKTDLARQQTPCRWAQAVPWCCWLWPPQGQGRWQAQTPASGCITHLFQPYPI